MGGKHGKTGGMASLSNSYYTEFARTQNELLESYYHYIDKCMEDAMLFEELRRRNDD